MCPRTIVFTLAMIVLFGNVAAARDERGFWMGGGVGSVSCPDFLDDQQPAAGQPMFTRAFSDSPRSQRV